MSNSFPLFSYNYIDFILILNFDFMPGPTNYKVFEGYYIKVIKYLSFHKVVKALQSTRVYIKREKMNNW